VPGEPAGIGPELAVRLAQRKTAGDLLAFADPHTLHAAAERLGLPLTLVDSHTHSAPGVLPLQPVPQAVATHFGQPEAANAATTIDCLRQAASACLSGHVAGLVTGPVHKAAINAGGIAYTGTTELLAEWASCDVVMMLATPELRVALATTHLPLAAVPSAITRAGLTRTLQILHADLQRRFGLQDPRIVVLGLNPHAGEDGLLGREELDTITPALVALRAQGMRLEGPLPADTAFLPHRLQQADAVLAMYHDQGLPVLKFSGFERAVNITLGLPYPRVAVDHGTALEIAGKGIALPDSLIAAEALCARLARPAAELRG
jgi:4-hydroxythreonine-4-phosphate dehydrogenase